MENSKIKFENIKSELIKSFNWKWIKCWSCGSNSMTLIDWFISQPIYMELTWNFIIWWPTIPMIALVCNKCWHVQYYALKSLLPNIN